MIEKVKEVIQMSLSNAENVVYEANIPIECLDCSITLLLYDGVNFHIFIFGDGCFVIVSENNTRHGMVYYNANTPFYPSYGLSMESEKSFDKIENNDRYLLEPFPINSNWKLNIDKKEPYHFSTGSLSIEEFMEVKQILICTDGLLSFKGISLQETLKGVINNKNTNGEFVTRKVRRFMKDINVVNTDDFTIGGFSI
ncbi:MAG: hypothetical protein A3K77_00105 [Euryarchaeota archaeon RBG_13_31_8]|nr:MAG: hypothetical protein A3K77_00105 [Euryarchaeota archaeon RBG_13_31_8]